MDPLLPRSQSTFQPDARPWPYQYQRYHPHQSAKCHGGKKTTRARGSIQADLTRMSPTVDVEIRASVKPATVARFSAAKESTSGREMSTTIAAWNVWPG